MKAMSIADFCQQHGISRSLYYKLRSQGLAPKEMRVGRRTLISDEAAEEWRRRMEVAQMQEAA